MKKRILLANSSKDLIREILHAPQHKAYQFETATGGLECLKKLETFAPDLLVIQLMLPEVHGIEILKRIRSDPQKKKIGIILTSGQPMVQNYHAALEAGADYFLAQPFDVEHLFEIIDRFFEGSLTPPAFSGVEPSLVRPFESDEPHLHTHSSYIKFWGTRGTNPVAGKEYLRYGGNTCCLEIRDGNDFIIIDAGTGIRGLGNTAHLRKAKKIDLFLGHTHWDHIIGFPFFGPLYNPDCQITIWSPIGFEKTTEQLFNEMLDYACFPVRIADIHSKLTFKDLHEGIPLSIGTITIHTHYAYHPGATFCFKIETSQKTFGYATDNELLMGYHNSPNAIDKDDPLFAPYLSLMQFFKEIDFLVHEAQYFPEEYKEKVGWGHSSVANAAVLVKLAKIKEWIVTHHNPQHTDADLDQKLQWHRDLLDECHHPCEVTLAYDGLVIPL